MRVIVKETDSTGRDVLAFEGTIQPDSVNKYVKLAPDITKDIIEDPMVSNRSLEKKYNADHATVTRCLMYILNTSTDLPDEVRVKVTDRLLHPVDKNRYMSVAESIVEELRSNPRLTAYSVFRKYNVSMPTAERALNYAKANLMCK